MDKRLIVLLLFAVGPSSGSLFAQSPPEIRQSEGLPPTAATQSTPPASTTVSVRGTIDKYDPATRVLSLSTAHGIVQLPVPPSTRIRQGWHKVEALELQKLAGDHATVRYTESGGNRTVESVHVFGK